MSIRPIMPSFKGYIQVHVVSEDDKREKEYTFNTNSIAFTPCNPWDGHRPSSSNIYYGDKIYSTRVCYQDLQRAVIKAEEVHDRIVKVNRHGSISTD